MRRDCENFLWDRLCMAGKPGAFPRCIINDMLDKEMIKNPKQAWRTLEKWSRKGWYNYGTTLDLGWKEIEERPIL